MIARILSLFTAYLLTFPDAAGPMPDDRAGGPAAAATEKFLKS
jgi:hypothetical protein